MLAWQERFLSNTNRSSFRLHLTQPMIEFLSAIAEDCDWDRKYYKYDCGMFPDNFLATQRALEERGLIEEKPAVLKVRCDIDKKRKAAAKEGRSYHHGDEIRVAAGGDYKPLWQLTPAGRQLVELFKITGMFREAKLAKSRQKSS